MRLRRSLLVQPPLFTGPGKPEAWLAMDPALGLELIEERLGFPLLLPTIRRYLPLQEHEDKIIVVHSIAQGLMKSCTSPADGFVREHLLEICHKSSRKTNPHDQLLAQKAQLPKNGFDNIIVERWTWSLIIPL